MLYVLIWAYVLIGLVEALDWLFKVAAFGSDEERKDLTLLFGTAVFRFMLWLPRHLHRTIRSIVLNFSYWKTHKSYWKTHK